MPNKDYGENVESFLTEDGNVQKVTGGSANQPSPTASGYSPLDGTNTAPDEQTAFENPGQGGVAHPINDAPRLPQVKREE